MTNFSPKKAGLLAFALALLFFLGWELYLRQQGIAPSYDGNEALWSYHRGRVYGDKANTTVFIGSSRIKYDLDVATWRSLTGDEPVELAHEGSTPTPVLHHLANDTAFKGKLVIDVTEGLFFAPGGPPFETPNKSIAYYNGLTPAQRVGFQLNSALESQLVFLDKDYFSLNALLNKIGVPKRANVFAMPDFPRDFGPNNFDRQNVMTAKFLADSNQINQVRGIWQFFASLPSPPPIGGAALDSFIMGIAASTNKIKARGGTVVFVRTPSSGPYFMGEDAAFPRKTYWDKLLAATHCPGIHFNDYNDMNRFVCPEFSHLNPTDAIAFTKAFVGVLKTKEGWVFPKP